MQKQLCRVRLLPSWEHGLKFAFSVRGQEGSHVALLARAWIEVKLFIVFGNSMRHPPFFSRGARIEVHMRTSIHQLVAPIVRAWIEVI